MPNLATPQGRMQFFDDMPEHVRTLMNTYGMKPVLDAGQDIDIRSKAPEQIEALIRRLRRYTTHPTVSQDINHPRRPPRHSWYRGLRKC